MMTKLTPASTPSLSRWRILCSLFLVTIALAAIGAIASSRASGRSSPSKPMAQPASKIESWVLEHTANGKKAEFFVELADQADLSGAASLPTKAEKGRYVYHTLLNKAQSTQEPILQWLRERGIEQQPFYMSNAILGKGGNREIGAALAARPDVARVE